MVVPMVENHTREESVPLPENQREEPEEKNTIPVQPLAHKEFKEQVQHVPAIAPSIVQ